VVSLTKLSLSSPHRYAFKSPFTAIGIPRVAAARVLNTVNKREMLKKFRKLAVQLHPDKCEHPIALPAMQALNAQGGTEEEVSARRSRAPDGVRAGHMWGDKV
jgi:hypothetical protein